MELHFAEKCNNHLSGTLNRELFFFNNHSFSSQSIIWKSSFLGVDLIAKNQVIFLIKMEEPISGHVGS